MLIDDSLILIDSQPIKEITSDPIPLTSLFKSGKHHGPIPMCVMLTNETEGGTSISLKLQQSDDEYGVFSAVPGAEMTIDVTNILPGVNFGWRVVPREVTQQWVRLVVTPAGTFTAGRIFAALVREDEVPMSAGQYIDAGVVWG